MPTYISLLRWTQEGAREIKNSPARLAKAKENIQKAGGKMTHFYMTMGEYDMVCVIEAPDDKTYAATLLRIMSMGSVTSHTLKAFSEDEYRSIIQSL